MKLLLWGVLIVLGVWALRNKLRAAQMRAHADISHPQIKAGEAMLCCAHCGVYFPESEATRGAAMTVYCCDEHRRASEKS